MNNRSKFNVCNDNTSRTCEGMVFDSELEMKYYRDVILPLMADGKLKICERQKKYILQPSFLHEGKAVLPVEYKADFYLVYKDGFEQVIDIKGFAEPLAKLKRKLFWYKYPQLSYVWIGYSKLDGGWVPYEKIQDGRKARKKLKNELAKKEKKD